MYRLMSLDIGDVRIGVAMSDLMRILAEPFETYTRTKDLDNDLQYFAKLAKDKQVKKIIIGLPINMDGTHGERTDIVKEFGDNLLKYTDCEIVYQDERLSTYEAEQILLEANMSRENRKKVIDKIAAAIILRSYMNRYSK